MIKNYALVNTNTSLVEKIIYWDGVSDIVIYDLPEQYKLILIEDKPAMVWDKAPESNEIKLVEVIGRVSQGMTWDGTKFNQDKNNPPVVRQITTENLDEI
jgi:uncharacterized protein YfaT (DUF1175 family)